MFSAMLPLLSTFAATCSKSPFLGLMPWYRYLTLDPNDGCRITSFDGPDGLLKHGADSPLLLIGLAILEDLIRIAALLAVGYVMYGGFQYLTSQGSPDVTKKAQQTIIYALIGVVVAVIAGGAVAFLGSTLGS